MIDLILDKCLDEIRAGRATVADCLAKYPAFRAELEPLLLMALELESAPDVKPSTAFRQQTRARLLALSDPPPVVSVSERRSLLRGMLHGVAAIARRLKALLRVKLQLVIAFFERLKALA